MAGLTKVGRGSEVVDVQPAGFDLAIGDVPNPPSNSATDAATAARRTMGGMRRQR